MKIRKNILMLTLAAMAAAAGPVSAAVVTLHAQGVVTVSDNIPALIGQQWTMSLVYDSSAPNLNPPDPDPSNFQFGLYKNTAASSAILAFDLSVGGYAIHVIAPDPFYQGVNLSVITYTSLNEKEFFFYVQDDALLPAWDTHQLSNLELGFHHGKQGFVDGTAALPANPAVTLADFGGTIIGFSLGGAPFQGSVTSVSFDVVTEPTPSPTPTPQINPSTIIARKKKLTIARSSAVLKGTTTGAVTSVTYRVGTKGKWKLARGTSAWSFKAIKLPLGKTLVTVVAHGPSGDSKPTKFIVIRK